MSVIDPLILFTVVLGQDLERVGRILEAGGVPGVDLPGKPFRRAIDHGPRLVDALPDPRPARRTGTLTQHEVFSQRKSLSENEAPGSPVATRPKRLRPHLQAGLR